MIEDRGDYDEEFVTDPPPLGMRFQVLRDEWIESPGDKPIRRILEVRLEGVNAPAPPAGDEAP